MGIIKKKRKLLGLSQKQLAEKVFVTQKAVSFWENGQREPDCQTLIKLSEVLNCSIEELVYAIIETKNQREKHLQN